MSATITIQIDTDVSVTGPSGGVPAGTTSPGVQPGALGATTDDRVNELIAQQGDEIGSFPRAKIGGYMSQFLIVFELFEGATKGKPISVISPLASQTVAWGDPFIYQGPSAEHEVRVPLPRGSKLPEILREPDFLTKPREFFQPGKETIWLQILNLDARMDTDIGPVRIILGETLNREYPDIFKPSLGAAQSLGSGGFPARLFFNPYALIETPIGAFRAVHGTLSYGRVTSFPPIGTPVTICECIPLDLADDVATCIKHGRSESEIEPVGRILALSHPIDMEIQLPGEEAYQFCEQCIAANAPSKRKGKR